MTMSSEMDTAFTSGAGASASSVGTLVVVIVCALAVLWLGWVVMDIGSHALENSLKRQDAVTHTVRAAIVVMLLIYLLS